MMFAASADQAREWALQIGKLLQVSNPHRGGPAEKATMAIIPLKRLRRADDLVARIEELACGAHRAGLGGLAYILETALIEANLYRRQLDVEHANRSSRSQSRLKADG